MATNPTLDYLLQGNDREQLDEPQSKTKLTLENPTLNYLMNPTEEQKQPTEPLTNPTLNYLMGSEQLTPQKETLEDLRNDNDFQERSTRFLSSLDEGETVDDLFGYFRGSDYNIADTAKTYFQSTKFTEEQKQDYAYLRDRFNSSDLGSFSEGLKATGNVLKELVTDPTVLASVFFVPWTGGTSLAARIATGKAAQEGLKKLTSAKVAKKITKGVEKVTKKTYQSLPEKLSKNVVTTIAATEGFLWGSTNNYLGQNIDVNVNRREEVNPLESLAVGSITAAVPLALRGTGAGITQFNKSVANKRAARIEGGEDYKQGILDKGLEKYDDVIDSVTPNYRRLSGFVNKPTSLFLQKIKEDKNLEKVIKLFRYDATKQLFGADALKSIPRSGRAFYEHVAVLLGSRSEELNKILFPLYAKGKKQVPTVGSRDSFISLSSETKTRESFLNHLGIPDNVNNAIVYSIRSGNKKTITVEGKKVSIKKAFDLSDEQYKNLVPAVTKISRFLKSIRSDAVDAKLKIGEVDNYLPRGWSYAALKSELKNLNKGIEGKLVKEIKLKEGLNPKQIKDLLGEMIDPNNVKVGVFDNISAPLKKSNTKRPTLANRRNLKNIDDSILDDYLDNSLENLLRDYTTQSSGYIQRKIHLGENLAEFRTKHLNKIKNLTANERKTLEQIYEVTTGQAQQITNPYLRTLSNIAIVGNQLALLPFATITSLSEIAVPLVRGSGSKKEGISTIFETANEYRKMWWNDVVKKDIADARPESLKELNRFSRAVNRSNEDRSLAMYGQAFGPRAMMVQNKFFKVNLLHDWTRFVQLVSFNVGKSKIYDNLNVLATNKTLSAKRKIRLENQLSELDIDINKGIKWVKSGGKSTGTFYNDNFLAGAARYVDEVVMNPTAAANQKPLWHSEPSTRWAFGLMGFPTAFSNTVIKNAVREVSLDVRTGQVESIPSVAGGITAMLSIAMFGNTLRSGGDNLERLNKGETELSQEVFDAAVRTGLLGPTENLYRTVKGTEYDNFARSIVQRFTGPAVDDIFRFFDDHVGPLAFIVDEIPGITAIRATNRELYDAVKKGAKEYDEKMGFEATGPRNKNDRKGFAEGLEVNVPYTKDEPEERVNPFTGEPYTAIYKR
tara:strand:- start:51 stop:3422 length:3372 start_codon:yes stop_codon:yes gene_type:complete